MITALAEYLAGSTEDRVAAILIAPIELPGRL
jgi:hypothetical protein